MKLFSKWYPLRFVPAYKERVWGGRRLQSLLGRQLPGAGPIGESWEITDRPEGSSVVSNGALAGRTLGQLLESNRGAILGDAPTRSGRFPLLVKVLDAREVLSLQVHPPASEAARLGGEPKTELWYFIEADPGAEILAGLRRGTTREEFARRIDDATVAGCFHRVSVRAGDAMFLPSGRVHALGAGVVLFEIQENSDTTYRVHDWNRKGLDGKARALHVAESMESIAFDDFEPGLVDSEWVGDGDLEVRRLVVAAPFRVDARRGRQGTEWQSTRARCRIVGVVRGTLVLRGGLEDVRLGPGAFCLLPAGLETVVGSLESDAEWLEAEPGTGC